MCLIWSDAHPLRDVESCSLRTSVGSVFIQVSRHGLNSINLYVYLIYFLEDYFLKHNGDSRVTGSDS